MSDQDVIGKGLLGAMLGIMRLAALKDPEIMHTDVWWRAEGILDGVYGEGSTRAYVKKLP